MKKEEIEVIVYLTKDYSKNKSIFINKKLTKKEITKVINDKFNKWYYYDILK